MPTVTIGFIPRERFSLAAESLQRILDHTKIPFQLIVVDCNTPRTYWRQVEGVLKGRNNVKVIHRDHYLLPNQSRNLVIPEAEGQFLCFIDNDVLVQDGWLPQLIDACEAFPADVAVPLIIEGPVGTSTVHFDELLGQIRTHAGPDGTKLEILPRADSRQLDRGTERRAVQLMEQHCLLFRRTVFDRIGPYDEELNTRDEIDLSLALHSANVPVVFEPKCEVFYVPPYPPEPEDLEYYFMKWDLGRAASSRDRIKEKWNLIHVPGDLEFVKNKNRIGQMRLTRDELTGHVSPGRPFVLVDQDWWRGTMIVDGLQTVPFPEHDGQYWGMPADDGSAIEELERLLKAFDAMSVVIGWPAFSWLEYYPGLHKYLRSNFRCVLENDRLVIFGRRA